MGTTIRTKGKSKVELLPEEALYLAERGSLQIWLGNEESSWSDNCWGVEGAVEMSVMECFAMFIGKEKLSWERYQVFSTDAKLNSGIRLPQAAGIHSPAYEAVPPCIISTSLLLSASQSTSIWLLVDSTAWLDRQSFLGYRRITSGVLQPTPAQNAWLNCFLHFVP